MATLTEPPVETRSRPVEAANPPGRLLGRRIPIAVGVLTVLAFGLRLAGLDAYALWHDEAWVAVSIAEPSVGDMLFFEYPQTTPPLLLLATRWAVAILGSSDWTFRLLPALAGAATAPLLYAVSVRLSTSRAAGVIAMALWSVNPVAIRYSQELKQYPVDAFAGLALILMTERTIARAEELDRPLRLWALGGLTLPALALSHVSAFFVAAVAVRIAWHLRTGLAGTRAWLHLSAYVGVAAAQFLALYLLIVRPQFTDWLSEAWSGYYLPLGPLTGLEFLIEKTIEFFPFLFAQWSNGVLVDAAPELFFVVAVIGLVRLSFDRRRLALYYGAALFAMTAVASAVETYPYGGRRIGLFLAPFIFIAVGYGLAGTGRRRVGIATLSVVAIVVLQLAGSGAQYEKTNEDVASVVETIEGQAVSGDTIGVHAAAFYAYRHYASDRHAAPIEFGTFFDTSAVVAESAATRLVSDAGGRLWLAFSKDRNGHRRAYAAIAEEQCRFESAWAFENAALYLYDCR